MDELHEVIDDWLNESPIPLSPLSKKQIKTLIILQTVMEK